MTDLHMHDDVPRRRRDPTRTTALRTAFNADAQLRLRSLRSQLRLAIIERGLLGNGTFQAPADRFRQFSNWFDYVATAELAAGQWSVPWIVKAVLAGQARANAELSNSIVLMTTALDPLDHLMEHELDGITAALKQKVMRLAAGVVRANLRPAEMFRIVSEPFAGDISHRLKAFVNTMTVQAFNTAKLQVYRQAGISKVGIVPESLPATNLRQVKALDAFSPEQERDDHGRFGSGGGSIGLSHSDDRPGVQGYAGSRDSFRINAALRSGKEMSRDDEITVSKLSGEIAASPAKSDLTVYRSISTSVVEKLKVGQEFTNRGFFSTTTDKSIADNHGKNTDENDERSVMVISVPKGAPALDVRGSHEKEVILQRNEAFSVDKIVGNEIHVSLLKREIKIDAKDDDEEDLVGVRTAGDDLVCEECDDIADGAPYALDEIEGLLPAHPHCRCTVYPWFDKRFKRDGATK